MSQEEPSTGLRPTLLGPPQLARDSEQVHLSTRKAAALLAYLAVTEQVHGRGALATLVWPALDPSRALANLRCTLWILNDALGEDWLEVDAETVARPGRTGVAATTRASGRDKELEEVVQAAREALRE